MNFYVPIFSKIVDSSLWSEPDFVVKIFITMLAKKDRDNVVRGNAFNIGAWARKTEKEAMDALKILAAPDTKRVEKQANDGRRIEKVADGWLILNAEVYQNLMRQANRREYQRIKQAEYRDRKKEVDNKKDLLRTHKGHVATLEKEVAAANLAENGEPQ